MRVTVLWEDQHGEAPKGFGPQRLLIACVRDRRPEVREQQVTSLPRKGNGNVVRELKSNFEKLRNYGPVIAVFDRDRAHELCSPPAPTCRSGTAQGLRALAPGDYDLVFLEQNMESLLAVVSEALGRSPPARKPNPTDRDSILNQAVWSLGADGRAKIQERCASFGRLVRLVAARLEP